MSLGTLHEIDETLLTIGAILQEVGGDITEADAERAIDEWLAETHDALDNKLDGYGALMREFGSRSAARKAEADRLYALAKVDANAEARLKSRLQYFFEAHGLEKIETDRFRFTLANNGGAKPVVLSCDPEDLPEHFQRVTVAADKTAIRDMLEAGQTLEFATLGERGRSLRIR